MDLTKEELKKINDALDKMHDALSIIFGKDAEATDYEILEPLVGEDRSTQITDKISEFCKEEETTEYVYVLLETDCDAYEDETSVAAVCATIEAAEKAREEFESQYEFQYRIEEQELHKKWGK